MLRLIYICLLLIAGFTNFAVHAETLNVYTTRNRGLIEPILQKYSQKSGIVLEIVYGQEPIKSRIESGQKFDVFLSGDVVNLESARRDGLLSDHIKSLATSSVPEILRASDGRWMALTLRVRGLYIRKNSTLTNILNYESLAHSEWRGRICSRPLSHKYNKALIGALLYRSNLERTRKWLTDLTANVVVIPEGGDRAVASAVASGRCDVGIGHSYYLGILKRDPRTQGWASKLDMVFPEFEKSGTHFDITGFAILTMSQKKNEALKLAEWLIDNEAQSLFASYTSEYKANLSQVANLSDSQSSLGFPKKIDDMPLASSVDLQTQVERLVMELGL